MSSSKIIIALFLFMAISSCNFEETITGTYQPAKGCDGIVDEILIKTTCEQNKEFAGQTVEITGKIEENECKPEIPQCYSGKQMNKIKSITIAE